jgi:hypothetical protein
MAYREAAARSASGPAFARRDEPYRPRRGVPVAVDLDDHLRFRPREGAAGEHREPS